MQRKVCIWLQELFSSYSVGYPAIQVFRCLDTFQRSPDRDVLGAARVFQVCRLLDLIPHGLEMQRKGNIWLQEHNCRPPGPLRRVINSPRGGGVYRGGMDYFLSCHASSIVLLLLSRFVGASISFREVTVVMLPRLPGHLGVPYLGMRIAKKWVRSVKALCIFHPPSANLRAALSSR
jgi:hypothetical protein